jgi:DNA-binding NtrC family response regulator/tetratricopeptide (TPR) repeat protein
VTAAALALARLARLNGVVPVAASALPTYRGLLAGRSLLVIDDGSALLPFVSATLHSPLAHVWLGIGPDEKRGVHGIAVGSPSSPASVRAGRNNQPATRVAESPPSYNGEPMEGGPHRAPPAARPRARQSDGARLKPSRSGGEWAVPHELAALTRIVEQSHALLAAGRHAPGLRLLRQAVAGLARRDAWTNAAHGALTLAGELMRRGRPRDAHRVLTDAASYAERANDGGGLLDAATLSGESWIDAARLDEAERVLTAALTSARAAADRAHEATLLTSLARCLFWRAEYAAASSCLESAATTTLSGAAEVRRLRMIARVAVARGEPGPAIAALEEARRQMSPDDADLRADLEDTWAFVELLVGDYDSVDAHVDASVSASRRARRPLRGLSARLLRAEADRRRSRPFADAVAKDLRLAATAPPVLKARWDLLAALQQAPDPDAVTARQVALHGLTALELFGRPNRAAVSVALDPVVADIVAIIRVSQRAEDDNALVNELCARVRERLRAAAVALMVTAGRGCAAIAGDGSRIDGDIAQRVLECGVTIAPARIRERIEAGAPIEYGGKLLGALCGRWTIGTTEDLSRAAAVLSTAAVVSAPVVAAFLARRSQTAPAPPVDFLGVTPLAAELRREIERAAAAPFAVLIAGESGSGKELVARGVHRLSARRDRAFCTLNCAALPDDLVEAELFGHARGSFTGAVADRPGVFEEASGGTLFLDEVGELSARAQAKLLRVIQEGELRRVGENVCRRVDVRIVAATNRDLRREVDAGRFRLDLLYRLDVVRIAVPPLRERPEDVAVLIDHFWNEATRRLASRAALAATTRAALASYSWPGNVRELQNVLAALAVRSPKRGLVPPTALPMQVAAVSRPDAWRLHSARRTFEASFIRAALVRTAGHRGRAADELGVSRQGLAKLMTRLGIE